MILYICVQPDGFSRLKKHAARKDGGLCLWTGWVLESPQEAVKDWRKDRHRRNNGHMDTARFGGSVFSYREVEAPWKLIVHYLQLNKETDLAHLIRRGSVGDQSSGCKHCGEKAMLGSFCKHCLLCSWTKGESPIPVGLICLHGLRHWDPSHSCANINNTHSLMASLCPYNALCST